MAKWKAGKGLCSSSTHGCRWPANTLSVLAAKLGLEAFKDSAELNKTSTHAGSIFLNISHYRVTQGTGPCFCALTEFFPESSCWSFPESLWETEYWIWWPTGSDQARISFYSDVWFHHNTATELLKLQVSLLPSPMRGFSIKCSRQSITKYYIQNDTIPTPPTSSCLFGNQSSVYSRVQCCRMYRASCQSCLAKQDSAMYLLT